MSLASLMVRTVTVIHASTRVDAYGDNQPKWDTAAESTTSGWLAQQSSIENRDGRNATSSSLVLYLPAGTVITARDRVRIDGTTYELVSEPLSAWTPRGEHHLEVFVNLVTG